MVKTLLAAGCQCEGRDPRRRDHTAFHGLPQRKRSVIELLLKAGADANSANEAGTTALMLAASAGNPAALNVLLAHGANVNAKDLAHGQTALIFAASLNRAEGN